MKNNKNICKTKKHGLAHKQTYLRLSSIEERTSWGLRYSEPCSLSSLYDFGSSNMKVKIKQIAADTNLLYALDEDGQVWTMWAKNREEEGGLTWQSLPPIIVND